MPNNSYKVNHHSTKSKLKVNYKNLMAFTKKTLKAIKDALPHGSLTEIAKENNVSSAFVGKLFSGQIKINKTNIKYIYVAQKKIKVWKKEQKKLENQITKTISN